MIHICRVCAHTGPNKTYICTERQFGWGDEFTYFQCNNCGCLQISNVPADLARFYPSYYYSFRPQPIPRRGFKAWLASQRDYAVVTGKGFFGRLLAARFPAQPGLVCLSRASLRKEMSILDLGCGSGQLLSFLHRAGFRHVAGADPFLDNDIEVIPELKIRRLPIEKVEENFDFIMLNHVFEHAEPEILSACRRRLKPGGKVLLRIPTVDSEAWEKYREDWVQVDAPRHLYLHTPKSLDIVTRAAGLIVEESWRDSSAFQFWGSELYRRGVSLVNEAGDPVRPERYFTKQQLKQFAREATKLNAADRGDQLAAILRVKER